MAEVLLSSSATVSSSSLGGNQATAPRNNRTQVGEQVGCSYEPLTSWMDKYINGGLSELVRPIRHQKPSRLSVEQQQQLKAMVLTQRPTDYCIERQMWTGAILCEVIAQRNYELSPALFEILTLKEDWGKLKYHQ